MRFFVDLDFFATPGHSVFDVAGRPFGARARTVPREVLHHIFVRAGLILRRLPILLLRVGALRHRLVAGSGLLGGIGLVARARGVARSRARNQQQRT